MKVWILKVGCHWESSFITKVFSSREKALKGLKEVEIEREKTYAYKRNDYWENDSEWAMITPYEVN